MIRGFLQMVVLLAFAAAGFSAVRLVRTDRQPEPPAHADIAGLRAGQVVAVFGGDAAALVGACQQAVTPGGRVVHVHQAIARTWPAEGPFDVVVLTDLPIDPTPLLAQVRASLRPDGRLVVLPSRSPAPLDVGAGFAQAYQRAGLPDAEPGDAALRHALDARLQAHTRTALAAWQAGPLPEAQRATLLADLNRIIGDRTLIAGLNDRLHAAGAGIAQQLVARLPVIEARLLQWLVLTHDDLGVLDPQGPPLDAAQTRALRTIHRLLLTPLLGPMDLAGDRLRGDPVAQQTRIEGAGFRRTQVTQPEGVWHFAVGAAP